MAASTARDHLAVSGLPADSAFHTAQISISFGEEVDFAALRSAWEAVAAAFPSLRSSFDEQGNPAVADAPSVAWTEHNWQASLPADPAAEWQRIVQSDAATAVASAGNPSCRVVAIRLPNGHGHALWSFHSALLDENAASAVLHTWLAVYDSIRTGAGVPELTVSEITAEAPSDEAWKESFEGFTPTPPLIVLPLPAKDEDRSVRRSISHTFERPDRAEFVDAAAKMGVGLDAMFGSIWAFVVARATACDEALLLELSSVSSGNPERTETLVARRHRVEACSTPSNLAKAFENECAAPAPPPPAEAAAALGISSLEPAAAWIFREHTLNDRLQLAMPRWMGADAKFSCRSAAPITLRFVATDRPELSLDYAPAALSDDGARLLFDLYRAVLADFVADPSRKLSAYALPAAEGIVVGPDLPPTFRSLVPQRLHEMLADVASEAPDAPAVQCDGETISFSKLNTTANQIARHLRKRRIEPGTKVAVSSSRSPQWVALLVGVLRAGGIVVPVPAGTTEIPKEAGFLIVDALPADHPANDRIIDLTADAAAIQSEKTRGIQTDSDAAAPAAAWLVEDHLETFSHETLVGAYRSAAALTGLAAGDRVLQFSPTGTPAAIEEVFTTLLSGATIVLRGDDRWRTRTAFQEFIEENAITTLSIPSAFFSQWIHYLSELSLKVPPTLRIVTVHGEIAPTLPARWRTLSESAQLLFRFPCAAAGGLSLATSNPDGFLLPAPACHVRIVDRCGLPVPGGLPGRIEITTGDAAFRSTGIDGFLSPVDGILPREILLPSGSTAHTAQRIRAVAASHPAVFDAHAELRLLDGRDQWCLWIVPISSDAGEPHDFREWLASRLPDPPRRIRAVPRLPLGPDGLVDSTALDELLPDDAVVAPARRGSEEEERLRQAISRALGGRSVDLDETITDGARKPQTAVRLHEAVSRIEPRVTPDDFARGFSVRSLLRMVRGREVADTGDTWSPITPIRAAGNLPPIVFVHDLEGSARIFEPLAAHLGDHQPCFALTARGLADPQSLHRSIPEMAAAYADALLRFDATGAFRLVGFGFGGLVAFEIASRLHTAGTKVPLVVLLATKPPFGRSSLLGGGWKRSLQGLFGRKPSAEPTQRQRRLQESPVYQANQQAAQDYAPAGASDLPMHVFVPEHDFEAFPAVESGWRKLCADARFYQVPCAPAEMLEEPAVEAIAEAVGALSSSGKVEVE